ncbi:DUF1385 domain-containing protein [Clostridium lacusfryxellense]|uniref:DUF1385 domain-containing protein n=1 Tax=Clostridium lacusfryxellense TaxID=205328 RepID=UPI001C0AFC1D|nr:DUF1385 domain-containing protein [Clostridium lacusfryxellense]MBU3111549.1 DUF1385 domain-containing protein [Clostridium lacusfryxellense]
MAKNVNVGGQAVIEGVMMRGKTGIATAVRTAQGEIVVEKKDYTSYTKKNKILGLPIIRGFVSLIESLVIGVKTLNYSASFFEEEGEPSKMDQWIQKLFKEKSGDVIMGISLVISLVISVGLFFILPTLVASIFSKMGVGPMGMNIVEGIIRVSIFLVYVYLIGKMEDIKRVYEYHGAEHKTIFCYENDVELTPENAAKFGRLHPRCGTNFLFLVMIVSIIVFSLTGWNSIWERIMYRIVLLPLISGVSFEIIKWMGKSGGTLAKILSYPGLKLQKLTTREPDLSQLEVAIKALKVAEGIVD